MVWRLMQEFQGKNPWVILSSRVDYESKARQRERQIQRYLDGGGQIFIEFTEGARKGSIGRLNITPQDCVDLYAPVKTGLGDKMQITKINWEIVFDDRPNKVKIKLEYWGANKWPGILRFDVTETLFVYETKPVEKKADKVLFDHFGVQLEVGQHVIYPHGLKGSLDTRFGIIEKISAAGTITIKPIKTRKGHDDESTKMTPNMSSCDIVVLDNNNIKDKVLVAKLTNG
jgi:hypothetical protein